VVLTSSSFFSTTLLMQSFAASAISVTGLEALCQFSV